MTTIVAPPSNAIKWQMGFNSAFKGLKRLERSAVTMNFVDKTDVTAGGKHSNRCAAKC